MDENEKVVTLPDNPVRCALMKAAEIVEERWCQGRLGHTGMNVCALGAIGEVTCGHASRWEFSDTGIKAAGALAKVVYGEDSPLSSHGVYIPTWNDCPGRTKEEVAAAMRKAASMPMPGDS